jgi:hypothetical protein
VVNYYPKLDIGPLTTSSTEFPLAGSGFPPNTDIVLMFSDGRKDIQQTTSTDGLFSMTLPNYITSPAPLYVYACSSSPRALMTDIGRYIQ